MRKHLKMHYAPTMNRPSRVARGFSLVEIMVAMTLGLLVSAGIVTLFTGTSATNRVQDAMARLQENGRYAISRITDDVRASGHQFMTASGTSRTVSISPTGNGILSSMLVPTVYSVGPVVLPDTVPVNVQAGWPANTPFPLPAETFLQGYECSTATCTPTLPTQLGLPAMGIAVGNRVAGTDVLTTRTFPGDGWSLSVGEAVLNCPVATTLSSITVRIPKTGAAAAENFVTGDWALVVIGSTSMLFRVTVGGGILTPTGLITGVSVPCGGTSGAAPQESVLYNFSRQLQSATYFVQAQADLNPDATAGRIVPTLMRKSNALAPDQLVQGVDRLDFVYGVEDFNGAVSYATADKMSPPPPKFACTLPPDQVVLAGYPNTVPMDTGCAWRATRVVEPHLLLNTVNDVFTLTNVDVQYRYSLPIGTGVTYDFTPRPVSPTLPTGLQSGRMMRREFTASVSIRSFNP